MDFDKKMMLRCLELAKNGLGTTYPNPLVGSVVVHNGKIIGEGWHYQSGKPHAEVNAINSVIDKSLLLDSTLYVNLEPCSHFGKTPPCADLIIANKIPRVVIASLDVNDEVNGRGVQKLQDAGVDVKVGICKTEADELNKRFITFHKKQRPYIILKWAESFDGFLAPKNRNETAPVWLSNQYSRQLVHKWRSEEMAILVGTQTVIDDNPSLTVRDWRGNHPIRVVIDRESNIPKNSNILDGNVRTIIFCAKKSDHTIEKCIFEVIDFEGEVVAQILATLYKHKIQSLIVEGGGKTLQAFINQNLWDEARIFKSPKNLGSGILAPKIKSEQIIKTNILDDELLIFTNYDRHNYL